ncbi:MAG: hypothetical protein HQ537_00490 [Parcubacteria group bacterium]|nr:hypothetical protein [Parcubacteria group bacterium]
MGVLDYVRERWDKLDSQERENVLSTLFPDMDKEARKEISLFQFNDLPDKHLGTWKNIIGTLIMAVTPEGFSGSEEDRVRNALTS